MHAEDVQERRLAGAGRPHDRHELAGFDVGGDAAKDEVPARALRVSSAPATSSNPDLSDRTYYTTQRDNPELGLFVSEPFISRVTGEPTFVLSRRLTGGTFHGIAGAAVDVDYIRRFYQALDMGEGSAIELLRADGRVLVAGGSGELGTASLMTAELYDPATGTFAYTGQTGEHVDTATRLIDGRVLVTGNNRLGRRTAELYDPKSGIFTPSDELPVQRCSLICV